MSFGSDEREMTRRAAAYVSRVLSGTLPRELPVEQISHVELEVNLRAAKAMALPFHCRSSPAPTR